MGQAPVSVAIGSPTATLAFLPHTVLILRCLRSYLLWGGNTLPSGKGAQKLKAAFVSGNVRHFGFFLNHASWAFCAG
jgi:hypothetical protein